MSDKYCDTTAYTYALTPTWGVAQDGDGGDAAHMGAATPATISVDMSTWTFTSGTSTFSIMGCTALTIGAGANSATNAQYNAVYATMLANIVAAINLATAANCVNIPAGWNSTAQVRDRVFARASGNNLQIMTRAGSGDWNTLVAIIFTNVTGSSPQSWSGGAGGCWGWLTTFSAMWPSGVASGAYGIWHAAPLAGVQSPGDNVYIRANNQTLSNTVGFFPAAMYSVGTAAQPVTHFIDSGNKWGTDSPTATLTINTNHGGGLQLNYQFRLPYLHINGKKIGTKLWNLKLIAQGAGVNGIALTVTSRTKISGFNMSSTAGAQSSIGIGNNYEPIDKIYSDFTLTSSQNAVFLNFADGAVPYTFFVHNGTFRNTGASIVHPGVLGLSVSSSQGTFSNVEFEDFVVGSSLAPSVASVNQITFIDCLYGGVTDRGPYFGAGSAFQYSGFVASYSTRGNRSAWIDNHRGMVEWNEGVSQPVLRATLLDGTTKWSWKMLPLRGGTLLRPGSGLQTPRVIKRNTLASGPRTFTAEFCISDTLTWNKSDVSILIQYRNASGEAVILDSLDGSIGALTASSQTWNQESAGKVTFSFGGTLYHNKYSISISTPTGNDLPLGADVEFIFCVNDQVSNVTQFVFVDPDVDIA